MAGWLLVGGAGALMVTMAPAPAHANPARVASEAARPGVSTRAADLMPELRWEPPRLMAKGEPAETAPAAFQPPAPVADEQKRQELPDQIVRDAENPIVDRISLPVFTRTAFGVGALGRKANLTSIQPVLPISLGADYLLLRPTIPFVSVPPLGPSQGGSSGLGDLRLQAYFVPEPRGNLTWGIGPTFLFPTARDRRLGSGQWGIGPALAAVWSARRWTIGGRIENYWSIAGDRSRAKVSQLTLQPILTYTLGRGWYLVSAPVIAAFWTIPQGEKWLLPVGGGIGKVMNLGNRPFNLSLQGYWHPVRPGNSEGWALVVQLQSLFPRLQPR